MLNFVRKHKLIVIVVLVDLLLTWLLVYSDIILPYISPSIEQYRVSGTSFPRDFNQKLFWIFMHAPTSLFVEATIGVTTSSNVFVFLPVLQTGLIAYYLDKNILHKRNKRK